MLNTNTKSTILGAIVGVILGILIATFIGCEPPSNIKITYSDWEQKTATVVDIEGDNLIVEVDGVKFTLKYNGELIGNQKGVEIRKVWKTRCENNHCELLDTNKEIRVVDDLVI